MNLPSDIFPPFPEMKPGEVWLVGAGPGDPRLLTLMAVHALGVADAVVHDALVDSRILKLARAGAEIHHAGKRGGKPSPHQRDINELIIALAKKGLRVLRLKGGDPFVFGRGGEEALALVRAGIPFRVVPGLTSGLAGPALAGIPATTRETNHAIILAAGYRAIDETAEREWEALAAHRPADHSLHGDAASRRDRARVSDAAASVADTPVTIIASATLENERVLETSLGSAAADAKANAIEPPTIIIVGSIAGLRRELIAGMVG